MLGSLVNRLQNRMTSMPHQQSIALIAGVLANWATQAGGATLPEPVLPAKRPATVANRATPTIDRTNQTGADAIAPILIAHGTLDGDRIIDFKLRPRCATEFVTAKGTITIDWRKIGNLAEHDEGNQVVTPIDDGNGLHQLAVPKDKQTPTIGDIAAVVNMGLSGIAEGCAGS